MRKVLLLVCIGSLLSSCGLIILKIADHKNTNAGPMDTEGMTDIQSPYNSDNVIFKTNRTFVYEVDQKQRNRNLKFKLELIVIPGSFNFQETKIKYKYYYSPADLTEQELNDFGWTEQHTYLYEYTSLIEDKKIVQLHPPRSKTLTCLEKAPFPELPHPRYKGAKKKGLLYIPKGNWGELGGSKIKWHYIIDSITYKNDSIPYYCRIQSTASSKKGGYNTLEMHFTADSGFTKLIYRFQDLTAINFVLKEIK